MATPPPLLPPTMGLPPQTAGAIPGLIDAAKMAMGGGTLAPRQPKASPYDDEKKLMELAKKLKDEAFDNRFIFERGWWRIILYAIGRQWIYYDVQRGQWVDKRIAKWIPRPVTNKIGETISSYRSVFQSVQLAAKCRPDGNDPRNIMTAAVADRLEPSIREEHGADNFQREADFWFITLGNVFLHTWWNNNAAPGQKLIAFERCAVCGEASPPDEILNNDNVCPQCKQPGAFSEALDDTGQPIGMEVGKGAGCTDVCSPFEIALPPGYMEFKDISHLIRTRWRTKQYAEAFWEPEMVKNIRFDKMPMERSLQLLRSLATTADASASPMSFGTSGSVSTQSEGIAEFELWLKPSREYAEGLLLRWAGEAQPKLIRMANQGVPGPLPYHDSKGNPLFPWLHAGYEHMGGRIWARSPLEPLLSKQDQINQLDSLMQLTVQRVANPVWLEPKGAEVKKFTGEPGLVVKYNPMIGGGNAKPERIPGENIPPTVIGLRQQVIQDFDTLAGTSDIMKGQRPPNIEAFSALQLLVERSQSRFGPALAERGKLYRGWYGLALELEREFGPDERVFAVLGPNQAWTFEEFRKADLTGAISILIEDGSQTPKTSLGKRAAIEQLNQLGFIDKNDPEQRYNVLRAFGQTDLLPSLDNDINSALKEQDAFERWANDPSASAELPPPMALPSLSGDGFSPVGVPAVTPPETANVGPDAPSDGVSPEPQAAPAPPLAPMGPPPPQFATPMPMYVQYWHMDAIHNNEHRKWANSDNAGRIFEARPELIPAFTMHMKLHDVAAVEKTVQQTMIQQAGIAAAANPAQGPGMALERSNAESGNTQDVPHGQSEQSQGRGPE